MQRIIDLIKKYKPLELDYNVQSAVENLKMAYWNNDSEKYAKVFTEAEEIIVNAICHFDYIVCERQQGEWNYIQAGMRVCPFCGAMPHKEYKNFCPNCGADMRGEE